MTRFLKSLGDRVNPIVVKEARQAVNSRLVAGCLLLLLGIQLTVMVLMLTARLPGETDLDLRLGRQVFTFVQGILLGACMLLIPLLTGGRLAFERSDARVDLLFITSLSPRRILAGKLAAAAALALLIFSACAPFMTFAYVLRGLDIPTIVVVLTADFLMVLFGTMVALFLASIPAGRGFRVFIAIFAFIGMCYVTAGMLALSAAFLNFEMNQDTTGWEFWAGFGGLCAAVLGLVGLLFVWSVALISPHAANRAVPVRAYLLGFWVVSAVGCAVWARQAGHRAPPAVWAMFWACLFAAQLLTAVSERDGWGPRVARKIPRRRLLRVPAFLFFSGAAGGLLFGVLGGTLTVAGVAAWDALYPTGGSLDTRRLVVTAGLVLGYAYCYGMTAVPLRRVLHGTAVKAGHTWLLALLLLGVGTILPYIVGNLVFESRTRYRTPDELAWLYLPNPFVTLDRSMWPTDANEWMLIGFVAVWAAAVTVANAGWLARQVADFRPPRDRASGGCQPPGDDQYRGADTPGSPEAQP